MYDFESQRNDIPAKRRSSASHATDMPASAAKMEFSRTLSKTT